MTNQLAKESFNFSKPVDTPGWLAQLDLEISNRSDRSVVSYSRQQGPLTIQHPFYPEDDICHLYLLHPPAGIVSGDKLGLSISVRDKGAALMTTPGATKFYRSNGLRAEQHQSFTVQAGSSLEWLPQETIHFPGAYSFLTTNIHLEKGAGYIGWEIHCLGLPANKKKFESGKAKMSFSLFRSGEPLLIESLKISQMKDSFQAAFLQDKPVFGSLTATGVDEALCEQLREKLPSWKNGTWGATLLDDVLVVRYLGADTNEARKLFIGVWEKIRPRIIGRDALPPRIWAT